MSAHPALDLWARGSQKWRKLTPSLAFRNKKNPLIFDSSFQKE
jgi:hypothetical protein